MKKMSKKMKAGGVTPNLNPKATVPTTAGSNGVRPNLNPKVVATPSKMYGGKMKMGGKMSYGGTTSMKKMGKKK
jgi:hypothetical protein